MTQYTAATALYQEVQLLNRYIKDAALKGGTRAFLVRLQVSLLPQLRGQAYDAYSTISFLFGEQGTVVLTPYAAGKSDLRRSGRLEAYRSLQSPTVVPLLVTDSIEQSLASTSASRIRSFGLALLAMHAGFGASASAARQVETLQAALGEESNSLLTVTKIATNVIRVRFGAIQQVGSGLAMVPRNHTVTVLLLVPNENYRTIKNEKDIKVTARLEVVNAINGQSLAGRPFAVVQGEVHSTVCQYLADCTSKGLDSVRAETADTLAYAVQAEDTRAFDDAFEALKIENAAKQRLWLDLLEILSRSAYMTTSFELPDPPAAPTIADQFVTAVDDGSGTTVRLRGLKGSAPTATLAAALVVRKEGKATSLLANAIASTDSVGGLTLVFPSLQKLSLCVPATSCTLMAELFWTQPNDRWTPPDDQKLIKRFTDTAFVTLPAASTKEEAVHFAVSSGTRQISRSGTGEGTLRLMFQMEEKHLDEQVFFGVDGADVSSATASAPAKVELGPKGWQVSPGKNNLVCVVTVSLANLSDDVDVRLAAGNGKASREPLVFRVKSGSNARH
jgi:hypothetical protein